MPVVGVVPPVPVELPPQAARSTSTLSAIRKNKTSLSCFRAGKIPEVIDWFINISFLSLLVTPAMRTSHVTIYRYLRIDVTGLFFKTGKDANSEPGIGDRRSVSSSVSGFPRSTSSSQPGRDSTPLPEISTPLQFVAVALPLPEDDRKQGIHAFLLCNSPT